MTTPIPKSDTRGGNRIVRSRNRLLLALGVLAIVLTGCASDAPLDTLDPAGTC